MLLARTRIHPASSPYTQSIVVSCPSVPSPPSQLAVLLAPGLSLTPELEAEVHAYSATFERELRKDSGKRRVDQMRVFQLSDVVEQAAAEAAAEQTAQGTPRGAAADAAAAGAGGAGVVVVEGSLEGGDGLQSAAAAAAAAKGATAGAGAAGSGFGLDGPSVLGGSAFADAAAVGGARAVLGIHALRSALHARSM